MKEAAEYIHYKCSKRGHSFLLRLTSMRPDPDRWIGQACGFCLRSYGDKTSVLQRVADNG